MKANIMFYLHGLSGSPIPVLEENGLHPPLSHDVNYYHSQLRPDCIANMQDLVLKC